MSKTVTAINVQENTDITLDNSMSGFPRFKQRKTENMAWKGKKTIF
jgi:hypothetical protein